jgi:hypothetical protein
MAWRVERYWNSNVCNLPEHSFGFSHGWPLTSPLFPIVWGRGGFQAILPSSLRRSPYIGFLYPVSSSGRGWPGFSRFMSLSFYVSYLLQLSAFVGVLRADIFHSLSDLTTHSLGRGLFSSCIHNCCSIISLLFLSCLDNFLSLTIPLCVITPSCSTPSPILRTTTSYSSALSFLLSFSFPFLLLLEMRRGKNELGS